MSNKIMLVEKDEILRKGENVSELIKNYFIKIKKL